MASKTRVKKQSTTVYGTLLDETTGRTLKASASFDTGGYLCISIEGYGDLHSRDGEECPVIIDYFDDKVNVVVWGNINKEDPTDKIDLKGAKESKRFKK